MTRKAREGSGVATHMHQNNTMMPMSEGTTEDRPLRVAISGRHLDDLKARLKRFPLVLTKENPDIIICYGGDGSLLGAEREWPGIPKCPLRDVKRNPKCPVHGEEQVLQRLVAGQLRKSSLMKLVAQTDDGTELLALNDIVLSKASVSCAVRTRIWLDDELFVPQNVGDGLLVATPFGSTGYYRSITRGSFRTGIGLAFNNPMDWQDYVVLPEETVVTVEILRGPALLLADNAPERIALKDGDRLHVRRSEHRVTVYGVDVFRCRDCYRLRQDGV